MNATSKDGSLRRRKVLPWIGASLAALLSAGGTYAGIAAQVGDSRSQFLLTILASVAAGVLSLLTALAGGYAIAARFARTRQVNGDMIHGKEKVPLWGSVPARNLAFTNRADAMDLIRRVLTDKRQEESNPASCVIYGMGGVGKTSLAIEYAYRYRAAYNIVWWLRAEEKVTALDDLTSLLAAAVGKLPEYLDNAHLISDVHQIVTTRGPTLLVYDNARDIQSIRDVWISSPRCHILVTSRSPEWAGLVEHKISVDVLQPDDAILLLRRHADSADADSTAAELADRLGRLPLALVQAGTFVRQTRTSLSHYSELFESELGTALTLGRPPDYKNTLAATWSVSIEQAQAEAPGSIELLRMFAFLAPERIPRWLVPETTRTLPAPLSTLATSIVDYDLAVAALARFSLINVTADGISLHRLVQAAVRAGLNTDQLRSWTSTIIDSLSEVFPQNPQNRSTWSRCSELIPHVLTVSAYAYTIELAAFGASLLTRAGTYLTQRGYLDSAFDVYKLALHGYERTIGEESVQVADMCIALAHVQYRRAQLLDGLLFAERAVRILERKLGTSDFRLADALLTLGQLLLEFARIEEAVDCFERALSVGEANCGANSTRIVPILEMVSYAFQRYGHYRSSLVAAERGARIQEVATPASKMTFVIESRLGEILYAMQRFEAAREHQKKAVHIAEEVSGKGSLEAFKTQNLLSKAQIENDLVDESIVMAKQSIDGLTEFLGNRHPDVAATRRTLGLALFKKGRASDATEQFKLALSIYEDVYGSSHPYASEALIPLALSYAKLGLNTDAFNLLARACDIIVTTYGRSHPAYAEVLESAFLIGWDPPGELEADLAAKAQSLRLRAASL
jgi:tetratricopeptide (TPR) repeat protein